MSLILLLKKVVFSPLWCRYKDILLVPLFSRLLKGIYKGRLYTGSVPRASSGSDSEPLDASGAQGGWGLLCDWRIQIESHPHGAF